MLKKQIEAKLESIAAYLLAFDENKLEGIGIKYGKLGFAIFHLMYYKHSDDIRFLEKGDLIINQTVKGILDGQFGIEGQLENILDLGRFLEFVQIHQLFEVPTNAILQDMDTSLHQQMETYLDDKYFNVMDGALSIGYYFLARCGSTQHTLASLEQLLLRLESTGELDEHNHIRWKSVFHNGTPLVGYHGSCSIINYACKMIDLGILVETSKKLIRKSLEYVFANKVDLPTNFFRIKGGEDMKRAALELPYGDLFVGYTLYRAGEVLGDEALRSLAIDVYDLAITRLDDETVVVDSGIAHGIMGTAMMINKMYRLSGKEAYLKATEQCYKRSLSYFSNPNAPHLNYKSKYEIYPFGSDIGFIAGLSGIGMSYLAFLDPQFTYIEELVQV